MSKVVNVYIVYDLDASPRNPSNNLKIRNFLFGTTWIVKNNDKGNYVWNTYRITFDGALSCRP